MEEWLIVDGYNVLGASSEAAQSGSLEEARDRLIRRLSEYQAISGRKVILVFDAHRMPGAGTKQELEQIEVHYTRHRETADERIESWCDSFGGPVGEFLSPRRIIWNNGWCSGRGHTGSLPGSF